MALLEVKSLRTSFFTDDGEVRAVDGVSFSVEPGKLMGIVGESGSGKTASVLSIMRLLPESAKVVGRVFGKRLHYENPGVRHNRIDRAELLDREFSHFLRRFKLTYIAIDQSEVIGSFELF